MYGCRSKVEDSIYKADSRFVPSQWETVLLYITCWYNWWCNDIAPVINNSNQLCNLYSLKWKCHFEKIFIGGCVSSATGDKNFTKIIALPFQLYICLTRILIPLPGLWFPYLIQLTSQSPSAGRTTDLCFFQWGLSGPMFGTTSPSNESQGAHGLLWSWQNKGIRRAGHGLLGFALWLN